MTHHCKTCRRTAPEVTFAKQSGSDKLRNFCNDCRNQKNRAHTQPTEPALHPREVRSAWADLCADCRPDWGWNYRHVPKNHGKSQNYAI